MKKILIVCDSHGMNWGAIGYAWQIQKKLIEHQVDIVECPGLSIKKCARHFMDNLKERYDYDIVVFGLGNPDVHPRMPLVIMKFLKKITFNFVRDSYFSIPPKLVPSYFLRIPFFVLRLIIIRFVYESYTKPEKFIEHFDLIYQNLFSNNSENIILPVFMVNSILYTKKHNENAVLINEKLLRKYPKKFLSDDILKPTYYNKFYNVDLFHFKNEYHELLSDLIIKKMNL
jgi:hypothetical protein